jgi:hypothetical protein
MSSRRGPDEADVRLERLLFAIYVHGGDVVFEAVHNALLEWLRCNYHLGFRQVIEALRADGMSRESIMDAVYGEHPTDCACWECIFRLQNSVVQANARRMQTFDTEVAR